jgi:hypothetical protein
VAKNRKVTINQKDNNRQTIRLDELAQSLPKEAFTEALEAFRALPLWGDFCLDLTLLSSTEPSALCMMPLTQRLGGLAYRYLPPC